MEQLEETIERLLEEIKSIKWVDVNTGQLQEEQPPIIYPAALTTSNIVRSENILTTIQLVSGAFEVLLVFKKEETNSRVPKKQRDVSKSYHKIVNAVFNKLQGYTDDSFCDFERTSVTTRFPRTGIVTVALSFSTSWEEHTSSS